MTSPHINPVFTAEDPTRCLPPRRPPTTPPPPPPTARRRARGPIRHQQRSGARVEQADAAGQNDKKGYRHQNGPATNPRPDRRSLVQRRGLCVAENVTQREREIPRRLESIIRILLEATLDDRVDARRYRMVGGCDVRRLISQNGGHRLGR